MTNENSPRAELVTYIPERPEGRFARAWQRVQPWLEARYWDLDSWVRYTAGPWLGRRFRDIERALEEGWPGTVAWIRALLGATVVAALFVAAGWLAHLAVGFWKHTMIGAHHSGVLATVTRPVHAYINLHAAGLPAGPATVWALWQLTAPALILLACLGSSTGRALWIAYGAAWCAMVWTNTPVPGQAIATALAATCWATVSALALPGLDLRPILLVPIRVRVQPKAVPAPLEQDVVTERTTR